jgi:hypothetical protein
MVKMVNESSDSGAGDGEQEGQDDHMVTTTTMNRNPSYAAEEDGDEI